VNALRNNLQQQSVVNALRNNLQQAISQGAEQGKEGFGDSKLMMMPLI